ncbi:hypothetical protein BKA70DRAFT_1234998 [Coprinopsis sp. MPI-PUGE-AT-0042]|nr:hypothetical protein BKA70DRAFT_1234998 [Coprinopsis sp. MPI-PUGE-AT-0042]
MSCFQVYQLSSPATSSALPSTSGATATSFLTSFNVSLSSDLLHAAHLAKSLKQPNFGTLDPYSTFLSLERMAFLRSTPSKKPGCDACDVLDLYETTLMSVGREYYLTEQPRNIENELGVESDGQEKLVEGFRERVKAKNFPKQTGWFSSLGRPRTRTLQPCASTIMGGYHHVLIDEIDMTGRGLYPRPPVVRTANVLNPILVPLLRRRDPLNVGGYVSGKKGQIAPQYLVPQRRNLAFFLLMSREIQNSSLMEAAPPSLFDEHEVVKGDIILASRFVVGRSQRNERGGNSFSNVFLINRG